jgi:hypothetical protein
MRRTSRLWLGLVLVGCSSVGGQDPSEEGMYSDEVQVEVDGVFVQCGNLDETNSYWQVGLLGPVIHRNMPVVCMGPQSTPDFDLDDAEPVGVFYHFPNDAAEIQARCASACLAAHDPEAELTPVCIEDARTQLRMG